MISEGEVYYDHTFDDEVTIVSVEGNEVVLDGPVNGSEQRKIKTWRFEHNIRAERYEKIREVEVEEPEVQEEQKDSIFDY